MDGRISNFDQVAYLRRYTLTEGRESGLRVIEVYNGRLRFLLSESKALDMMQLFDRGVNCSFLSKNAFTAGDLSFSKRFEGGMLYTCGLDSVGVRDGYELHGSFHNSPARVLRAERSEEGITVVAEIADTELFGKNLIFTRKIFTAIGSDAVSVEDTIENAGTREEKYCILYHINLGYPLLDAGVAIEADEEEVLPRTAWAEKRIKDRLLFSAPEEGEEERCYFIRHRRPLVKAVNRKLGRSFELVYSQDTLPCFIQWCSAASKDYALGLEPSSTYLDGKFAYRTLSPSEKVKFALTLSVKNL